MLASKASGRHAATIVPQGTKLTSCPMSEKSLQIASNMDPISVACGSSCAVPSLAKASVEASIASISSIAARIRCRTSESPKLSARSRIVVSGVRKSWEIAPSIWARPFDRLKDPLLHVVESPGGFPDFTRTCLGQGRRIDISSESGGGVCKQCQWARHLPDGPQGKRQYDNQERYR